jgi:CheY-like chemotaxis protein
MDSFHYRILVVDDDEQLRRMLERMLSNAGYEVRTAKDGFDALAQMRQGVPELTLPADRSRPDDRAFCR